MKMKIKLSEKGQALAEYAPLIPPILLLSVIILIPLAENASNIFCQMVNAFDPAACQPVEEEEEDVVEEGDTCETVPFSQGSSYCSQHDQCAELPGVNEGTYWSGGPVESFIIKAGQGYHVYEPGVTDDGCYVVNITANHVDWERVGSGPNCKDISHAQVWNVPVCQSAGEVEAPPEEETNPEEGTTPEEEAPPGEEEQGPTPPPGAEEDACLDIELGNGGSMCDQHGRCGVLPGLNEGMHWANGYIHTFVIKAGQNYHYYGPGTTNDGCYVVTITENQVDWQRIGSGRNCKDISHSEVWQVPLCALNQ